MRTWCIVAFPPPCHLPRHPSPCFLAPPLLVSLSPHPCHLTPIPSSRLIPVKMIVLFFRAVTAFMAPRPVMLCSITHALSPPLPSSLSPLALHASLARLAVARLVHLGCHFQLIVISKGEGGGLWCGCTQHRHAPSFTLPLPPPSSSSPLASITSLARLTVALCIRLPSSVDCCF